MKWQARDIMNDLAASSNLLKEVDEDSLAHLKRVLLKMMRDLHEVCESHNIRYSLFGGSLLGAVRHQGFIPWDDDIDIVIPREDWERLKTIFEDSLGENYVLEAPNYGGKDSKTYFGKMYLKGTKLLELQDLNSPFEKGIWIDFFILENCSKWSLVRRFDALVSDSWRIITTCQQYYLYPNQTMDAYMGATRSSALYFKARKFVGFCFSFISHKRFTSLFDKFVSRHRKTYGFVTVPTGRRFYKGEMLPASVCYPFKTIDFEGSQLGSFADPEAYCRNIFGDNYMQLPPVEKRERHFYVDIDFGVY